MSPMKTSLIAILVGFSAQANATCLTDPCTTSPIVIDRLNNGTSLGAFNLQGISTTGIGQIKVEVPTTVGSAVEIRQNNVGNISAAGQVNANFGTTRMEAWEVDVTAVANNATVEVSSSVSTKATQLNSGNVSAQMQQQLAGSIGKLDLSATAIGNNLTLTGEETAVFDVRQQNTGRSVSAAINTAISGPAPTETNIDVQAVGNNFGITLSGGAQAIGSIDQENCADVSAQLAYNLAPPTVTTPTAGRDPIKVTAIGNSVSISLKK